MFNKTRTFAEIAMEISREPLLLWSWVAHWHPWPPLLLWSWVAHWHPWPPCPSLVPFVVSVFQPLPPCSSLPLGPFQWMREDHHLIDRCGCPWKSWCSHWHSVPNAEGNAKQVVSLWWHRRPAALRNRRKLESCMWVRGGQRLELKPPLT